jgi:hypothetical protein
MDIFKSANSASATRFEATATRFEATATRSEAKLTRFEAKMASCKTGFSDWPEIIELDGDDGPEEVELVEG